MAPHAKAGLPGTAFGGLLATDQIDIGRDRHLKTQAFGKHLRFEVGTVSAIDMGQRTAIAILAVFTRE
ncbi:hypothetical protein D3C84_1092090 [compost metagenome]